MGGWTCLWLSIGLWVNMNLCVCKWGGWQGVLEGYMWIGRRGEEKLHHLKNFLLH